MPDTTKDGTGCDDGNACTLNDTCQNGACLPGTPKDCGDSNECTRDSCDPTTGQCLHEPIPGQPCETGNKCTADVCGANGQCQQGPPSVLCPQCQVCDPVQGICSNLENGAPCQDDDVCTLGDTCHSGQCRPGPVKTCSQCESCADVGGIATCVPDTSKDDQPCEDGDKCTLNDTCQAGVCVSGLPKDCDDNNACTADTCNPTTGQCEHDPLSSTPCGTARQTCCAGICCPEPAILNEIAVCLADGSCGAVCPASLTKCPTGVCTDLLTDMNNCGGCGNGCNVKKEQCYNGMCRRKSRP